VATPVDFDDLTAAQKVHLAAAITVFTTDDPAPRTPRRTAIRQERRTTRHQLRLLASEWSTR